MIDSTNSLIGTASISAMDLRKEPGRFLDRVSYRGESFLIERAGEPKAVLVPVRDYREMKRLKQVSTDQKSKKQLKKYGWLKNLERYERLTVFTTFNYTRYKRAC